MRIRGFEMRAVQEPLVLTERDSGVLAAGSALIEVLGCGICHTDLGFLDDGVPLRHALPLVLGHEIVGRVLEAPGDAALVGREVIVPAVMPCGACALCAAGRGDICRKQVFPGCDDHGGFATHVVVPAAPLCVVPRGVLPPEKLPQLAVVADAVSTAFAAVRKATLHPGNFAIFVGTGGVGGFGAQIARARGARVLALDIDDARLALLQQHGGADWVLNTRNLAPKELKQKVRSIAREAGLPDNEWRIFETSGTAAGQATAFSLLNFGALLGIVGFHSGEVSVRLSNLMAFAARAEGTWGCPPDLFDACLALVLDGKVVLDPFVQQYPMSQVNEVLGRMRRHELKARPVLVPDAAMQN